MFVVTNRKLNPRKKDLKLFGHEPNEKGPNELRLVKVVKTGSSYVTTPLMDKLSKAKLQTLIDKYNLPVDPNEDRYASLEVACQLFAQSRRQQKNILFFVHGYNNDLADIMKTAYSLERLYNVIVVPFSWPANGGGKVSGMASYLSDKADARVSMESLNRFIAKVQEYHKALTEAQNRELQEKALAKFPNNPMAREEHFAKLLGRVCKVTMNLLCHSMGNYLFKYALKPGEGASRDLVFDNVCLVAADANNENHSEWAEQTQVRNRLYIVINENDFALKFSRVKPGKEQKPRLGHYLKNLEAQNAHYLDVTEATGVGKSHSYFTGAPVNKNNSLKRMFASMFEGDNAERKMHYHADTNTYSFKRS
jgi:esterase/lipase superfamily enzyme